MANKGTVDKFIGDAVMGIWNAPMGRGYSREEKNRFPLHPKTLYGAARLCYRQSWIIFQYQRLGGRPGLWRAV
jgi:class 3 adenylate cyclase